MKLIYSLSEYILMSNLSPEFLLLGLLASGPSHGYDLHQKLKADLGQVWKLSQSQAYNILKRLETRGDVSVRLQARRKLPARQILSITKSGRLRFEEWLFNPSHNARAIRLEFLTRLYFTHHCTDQSAQVFSIQYEEIRGGITRLEKTLAELPPDQIFNVLSLELRIRQLRLLQKWMQEVREHFNIPVETHL
jgi:DNA-binding PadR family transcriptional regulator